MADYRFALPQAPCRGPGRDRRCWLAEQLSNEGV